MHIRPAFAIISVLYISAKSRPKLYAVVFSFWELLPDSTHSVSSCLLWLAFSAEARQRPNKPQGTAFAMEAPSEDVGARPNRADDPPNLIDFGEGAGEQEPPALIDGEAEPESQTDDALAALRTCRDGELGEGVASLKAILGDELPDHHAAHLLNLADMDISLAVAMFFDGNDGRAPAAVSAHTGVDENADVLADLYSEMHVQGGVTGPRTPRNRGGPQSPTVTPMSADVGPGVVASTPSSLPREPGDAPANGHSVDTGSGMERARQRRAGAAPAGGRGAMLELEEFDVKAEAMRSVLGADVGDETLHQLLRATGGDVQLALDAFFDNDGGFVFVGSGLPETPNGIEPPMPVAEARGRRRRQQQQRGGGGMGSDEAPGPRKPFEDLALMLGSGVKAHALGPIMVEAEGDVHKAWEIYCQRASEPAWREQVSGLAWIVPVGSMLFVCSISLYRRTELSISI